MKTIAGLALIAIFLGFVAIAQHPAKKGEWRSRCAAENTRAVLDSWTKLGVIRSMSGNLSKGITLIVEDRLWAEASHDAKVSMTAAAYCTIVDDQDRGWVYVRGYRDGKTRATVSNGDYFDS